VLVPTAAYADRRDGRARVLNRASGALGAWVATDDRG
jgi:hypothetical protein